MKVYSWNIRRGGGTRLGRIQEVIAGHNPEILVLPEFRNNPAGDSLRPWLRDFEQHYQSMPATELAAHNTVLLSAKEEFVPLAFSELGIQARRCIGGWLGRVTVLAFYFATIEAKCLVFEFIKRLPKKMLPSETLLMGDFNTGYRYWDEGGMDLSLVEEFGALLGCGWVDVWRQRNPGIREWPWVEPWGRHVGYRLDHTPVSPGLLPKIVDVHHSHAEHGRDMSDHSGLMLELRED